MAPQVTGRPHVSTAMDTVTDRRRQNLHGSWLWNSLSVELRQWNTTLEHFKRLLKTLLFVEAAMHCGFLFDLCRLYISTLTYL